MFSLRDVQRHATLKRNIGGLYTKTAVKEFEPNVDRCVDALLRQLAEKTKLGSGSTVLDMSFWLHLFAFEILSEVNTSKKLGFLDRGEDVNDMIGSADKIFLLVGLVSTFVPFESSTIHSKMTDKGCPPSPSSPKRPFFSGY